MATTGRTSTAATAIGDVVAVLSDARFVRVIAADHGDALAASGILAQPLEEQEVPFQIRVIATPDDRTWRSDGQNECVVAVGLESSAADAVLNPANVPTSVSTWQVAKELGGDPDPTLALAGVVAAGVAPGAEGTAPPLQEAVLERRPGVAVPTVDLADGLAHSTLVHAAFSGDESAAGAALADLSLPPELDEPARRRVASFVVIETSDAASDRASTAVERFVRPYVTPTGPFETLGGYADVLDTLATTAPGTGVALALGRDVRSRALEEWREHAIRLHEGLQTAHTGRYDGLFVGRHENWPTASAARLLLNYRSPEPVTLAVGTGEATLVGADDRDLGAIATTAAEAVDGQASDAGHRARIEFDPGLDATDVVSAVREAQ